MAIIFWLYYITFDNLTYFWDIFFYFLAIFNIFGYFWKTTSGHSAARHVGFVVVLPRCTTQFFPDYLQLAGKCFGVQWIIVLLGWLRCQLFSGIFYQFSRGNPILLCRMVCHGQVGTEVDSICYHDDGRHFMHLLHVHTSRYYDFLYHMSSLNTL